jgi:hypothetical protein
MERKTYFYIVAFGLSFILLYSLMVIFFKHKPVPTLPAEGLKVLFALFIMTYETISAKTFYKKN